MSRRSAFAAVAALASSGCMAAGVQFAGERQPAVVNAAAVQVGAQPPGGARRLGRAKVECSPLEPEDELDGARYSDVSCSRALLHAALREAAAEAGGDFSTLPECEEKRSGGGEPARTSWIGCSAEVWGPASGVARNTAARNGAARNTAAASVPAPSFEQVRASAVAGAPRSGSVRDVWQISFQFWPAQPGARAAARDIESVSEVDFPQVGQRRLGDVSAECDSGCATDSLRQGLRAAAGFLGASTLVDVRCVQRGSLASCVGSLTIPEHDEAELAGTR